MKINTFISRSVLYVLVICVTVLSGLSAKTAPEVLFQDDFSYPELSKDNWALDYGTPEMIVFENGVMRLLNYATSNNCKFRLKSAGPFKECEISFQMRFINKGGGFAAVRLVKSDDRNTYIGIGLTASETALQIMRLPGGVTYKTVKLTVGIAHDMQITYSGTDLSVKMDGQLITVITGVESADYNIFVENNKNDVEFGNFLITKPGEQKKEPVKPIASAKSADIKSPDSDILFQDDFCDPDVSRANWALDWGTPSMIAFENGVMRLMNYTTSNNCKFQLKAAGPFKECEISFRVRFIQKGGFAAVRLVKSDDRNVYTGLGLTANEANVLIMRQPGGISYKPVKLNLGIAHDMKITYSGTDISVEIDDQPVTMISGVESAEYNVFVENNKNDVEFGNFMITKPREQKKPGKVLINIINNSSFEYADAPNLPDHWGLGAFGMAKDEWIGRLDELWSRWRRDTTDPVDGKHCMRVDGVKILATSYLDFQAGKEYTFSAYLKSSIEQQVVKLRFSYYKGADFHTNVTIGKKWQRITWTFAVRDNTGGIYLSYDTDAVLWVDAVQLVLGKDAGEYQRDAYIPGQDSQKKIRLEVSAIRTAVAPNFDGTMNDPAWKNAAKMDLRLSDNGNPTEKTSCFLLYDEKNIYVGFRCYDSQMEKLRAKITQRDGTIWNDDSVELFVGPSGPHGDWAEYYHLGVSITGAQYDANKMDPSWNRDWQAKTVRFADHWEAVLILPIIMFDLTSFTLSDWIFNACRENGKIKEYSAWSPTFGSFHKAENFGILKALPKEITAPFVHKATETVSADCSVVPATLKVDGKDFFAYGITWQSGEQPPGENTFKYMRKSGMNLLVYHPKPFEATANYSRRTFELAAQYNIKIAAWLSPGSLGQNKAPAEIARQIVMYKKYPSIICWMVVDEPHAFPEEVKACLKTARETDPARPSFFNVTPTGLGMRIADLTGDLLMMDTYNFFFDSSIMADLKPRFSQLQKEITNRPGWTVLQAFGNCMWIWRGPTPGEMTAQTYLALVHGITGITYFNAVPLRNDTRQQMAVLGKEIKQLEPILLSRELGKIISSNPKINYCVKKYAGKTYMIAINSNDRELETTVTLEKKAAVVSDFFTGSKMGSGDSSIKLRFQSFERKVIIIQ